MASSIGRRVFVTGLAGLPWLGSLTSLRAFTASSPATVVVAAPQAGEDLFRYVRRIAGRFDADLYRQLLGACNEFKEGDQAQALAAADDASRENARLLLRRTLLRDFSEHPIFEDPVVAYGQSVIEEETQKQLADWTFGELVVFLLDSSQQQIKSIMPGLSSDVIACVVKLMSNLELIEVGSKIFNPLPGSKIGAAGYLSARIQPNSPTDNVQDIQWQVFNGWSYAVGDALLGTNPVSSEIDSVAAIEMALADLVQTFELQDILPHCVLAHVDVQAEVEKQFPGSTQLWFQSLAGVEDANTTFDISVAKMVRHARTRSGRYGLYFETGQGADETNGHGKGFDMVIHESRKYGFARGLKREVVAAQVAAGAQYLPWVHLNDVAGFIGPEVFRTREQLVRCCLEDIVMGKLHGLTIGLDICSTLHMDVDLDDLDWCIDQIMPAAPAYLMALPTKNDPMLGYLTTSFQDHVRVRHQFNLRVNDGMWEFFKSLDVIDQTGEPTQHFGQPTWVYLQYCRRKGDTRSDTEILAEGKRVVAQVRGRGVPIAEGFGQHLWDLEPELDRSLRSLYQDSKRCIWAELPDGFEKTLPQATLLSTISNDREDYILHPPSGESLSATAVEQLQRLAKEHAGKVDVQFVISDGLNALALTDEHHLIPYLTTLRAQLLSAGFAVSAQDLVVRAGRVRVGYRIGEWLYGGLQDRQSRRVILHIIGERPGSGHHAFSVYITAPTVETWANSGAVDHNITQVVSGIADTALAPSEAAEKTLRILKEMIDK